MTDTMDLETMAGAGRQARPPELWDRARQDYLAGFSATEVCARYGVSRSGLSRRAAVEGWRRMDQPGSMGAQPIVIADDLTQYGYADLADLAMIHLREAIVAGRASEATTWLRIHTRLYDEESRLDALEEEFRDHGPAGQSPSVDTVDTVDRVFSAPESTPVPGFSPGSRPRPGTPAPPASSPDPAPGSGAESGRTGR